MLLGALGPVVIIIYHDFLYTPRNGSHVKSDNIQRLAHTLDIFALIFNSCAFFYSLSQPHHVTASHHSPGDNYQSTGGRPEHRAKQKWPRETQLHMYQGSPLFPIFFDAQPPPSFLCCPSHFHSSHHLSSPTSVSLVPALPLIHCVIEGDFPCIVYL